jgi:hypothetical protein
MVTLPVPSPCISALPATIFAPNGLAKEGVGDVIVKAMAAAIAKLLVRKRSSDLWALQDIPDVLLSRDTFIAFKTSLKYKLML